MFIEKLYGFLGYYEELEEYNINEYGFSPKKPIMAASVYEQYKYLESLRYDGKPVYYERIGYIENIGGGLTDKFLIKACSKSDDGKTEISEEFVIYINPHGKGIEFKPIKNFTLALK